ncbi:MAG: 3-deoxy-8-phosphooctulonate synthase [Omnitrophica bacterium RBG_13_46_9]|nr:MAG: 3-deoxy-8-phosphooctulonate synthase [Omnitrophica bacterium RBG_13_46_9]
MNREVQVKDIKIGRKNPVVLIAGPCVIESEESAIRHAKAIKAIADGLNFPFIFKASYDKANRSSIRSYRGPGLKKGVSILEKVKKVLDIPVMSDVHSVREVREAKGVLDVIQIPAFLSRQTDLILAAAKTKKPINIKKGQFLSPWDMKNVVEKIEYAGNRNIIITERGTTFGYNMLVSDFRSVVIMKKFGYPICFDASHSVQIPGGLGTKSGGQNEFIAPLAFCAVVCGADAIFVEVHENPRESLSDGPNMLKLSKLKWFLSRIKSLETA